MASGRRSQVNLIPDPKVYQPSPSKRQKIEEESEEQVEEKGSEDQQVESSSTVEQVPEKPPQISQKLATRLELALDEDGSIKDNMKVPSNKWLAARGLTREAWFTRRQSFLKECLSTKWPRSLKKQKDRRHALRRKHELPSDSEIDDAEPKKTVFEELSDHESDKDIPTGGHCAVLVDKFKEGLTAEQMLNFEKGQQDIRVADENDADLFTWATTYDGVSMRIGAPANVLPFKLNRIEGEKPDETTRRHAILTRHAIIEQQRFRALVSFQRFYPLLWKSDSLIS